MARIGIENIREVRLNIIPIERKFNSGGSLAVHDLVLTMYHERGYDNKPKSAEEAAARGETSFNGLVSSFTRISSAPTPSGNIVIADIAPTRYLIGQALRDLEKKGRYHPTGFPPMSPDMANVSLVVPVKIDGAYFLMSQIKGKALGSGEIHAAMVAGNVDAKYLSHADPLIATLQHECSEEVGMDLSGLDPTSALYMVDERETGQVNFTYLAHGADAAAILGAYETSVQEKMSSGEQLEVMALALVPFDLALRPLERGKGLSGIKCFHPSATGLAEKIEDRQIRPYTAATLDYLATAENVRFLLEKAGF